MSAATGSSHANRGDPQGSWDAVEPPEESQRSFKHSKANNETPTNRKSRRNKKKKSRAQRIKHQQQQLIDFATSLVENLPDHLANMYDEEQQAELREFLTIVLSGYEEDVVIADSFLEAQKEQIVEFWQLLTDNLNESYNLVVEEETSARDIEEREDRLERLRKQGLKIGPAGNRKHVDPKAEEKRKMREKLRRAKLVKLEQEHAPSPIERDSESEEDIEPSTPVATQRQTSEESVDDWDAESDSETDTEQVVERARCLREDDKSDDEDVPVKRRKKKANAKLSPPPCETKERETSEAKPKKTKPKLRWPICVVMGHVDAGKTTLLDKIQSTNVQSREAGNITQSIRATFLSVASLKTRTERLQERKLKYKVPGLLFIDTPGHEYMGTLRERGSSLCDIAIIVVNIHKGLEQQTIESMRMLDEHGVEFVVAVNQIDRLNGWKSMPDESFRTTLDSQSRAARRHLDHLMDQLKTQMMSNGWNCELYCNNSAHRENVCLVPISAVTGEGLPDLLMVMITVARKHMAERLTLSMEDFQCSVLEVTNATGHGAVMDVILSNGVMRAGDTIVVSRMNGATETKVRALLVPKENPTARARGELVNATEVCASAGVRVLAPDLRGVVAGSKVLLIPREFARKSAEYWSAIDACKTKLDEEFSLVMDGGEEKVAAGICVQSSTLGGVECLVSLASSKGVPVFRRSLGDVRKDDVIHAATVLQTNSPEYGVILAFDVGIRPDAREQADQAGVVIFEGDIVHELVTAFERYYEDLIAARPLGDAVFPCVIDDVRCIRSRKPTILQCRVARGRLHPGTMLVPNHVDAEARTSGWTVSEIRRGDVTQSSADVGDVVTIRLADNGPCQFDRHFDETVVFFSKISRKSIDAIKANFRHELEANHDFAVLLVELKHFFGVLG